MSGLTPHGEGFSFLDSFALTEGTVRGCGTKHLDPALPFFADHFPGQPLMPAVLLVECAAQSAGALWAARLGPEAPAHFVLAQIVQFKVLQPVVPGETVESEIAWEAALGKLAQFTAVLTVSGREVARGRIVLGEAARA